MKKKYVTPSTISVSLKSLSIMSGSITRTSGVEDLTVAGNTEDSGITYGNARSANIWGDDE